jgi:hypothetical protein
VTDHPFLNTDFIYLPSRRSSARSAAGLLLVFMLFVAGVAGGAHGRRRLFRLLAAG